VQISSNDLIRDLRRLFQATALGKSPLPPEGVLELAF